MKKFTLALTIFCASGIFAFAGGYSKDKEVMQQAPPPCEWYRAHEWDLDLWGAWAFSGNSGDYSTPDFVDPDGTIDLPNRIDIGKASHDRLMGRDDTWGGGLDVKYFFTKYFGVGVEGLGLAAKTNFAGAGLGTFTFRWPIGCSRFAPYVWGGVGALGGGGGRDYFFNERENDARESERHYITDTLVKDTHTRVDGQLGVGIEVRITPRVGVMTDFAWNFIGGHDADNQDFGLIRSGVTLSY